MVARKSAGQKDGPCPTRWRKVCLTEGRLGEAVQPLYELFKARSDGDVSHGILLKGLSEFRLRNRQAS